MTALARYVEANAEPAPRRLGALLGLPEAAGRTDLTLADTLSQGLTVAALERLIEVLGRAALIGPVVPETTYRRTLNAGQPFSRELSDRIYEVARVIDAAARVYRGDQALMRRFLEAPHPLLEGRAPLAVATASAAGADAVVSLLDRLEAGFPV